MSPWQRLRILIRRTDRVLLVYIGIVLFFIAAGLVLRQGSLQAYFSGLGKNAFKVGLAFLGSVPILIVSIVIHEVAHGWMAYKCGDPTAKIAGRLSLNPLRHVDTLGTIIIPGVLLLLRLIGIPIFLFGWAKPVPVNPYNFKNRRRDDILVSVAGPASNILTAVLAGALFRFMVNTDMTVAVTIPGVGVTYPLLEMLIMFVMVGVFLALFNLIPIPPLDGSHILENLLPPRAALTYRKLRPFSFFIIILLVMTGATRFLIHQPAAYLIRLFLGY